MTRYKKGLHFTWFTGSNNRGIYFGASKNNGRSFSEKYSVIGKGSKHCRIASLLNNNILIVWNETFANGNKFRIGTGLSEIIFIL
ncbi:MAG: hypothetical protein ABI863_21645 [Ginsengibacter sp.]